MPGLRVNGLALGSEAQVDLVTEAEFFQGGFEFVDLLLGDAIFGRDTELQFQLGVLHQIKLVQDVPLEGNQLLAGQFPGPAGAVEGDEFRLARCLDAHAILH